MNRKMLALVKKDLRGVASNKRMMVSLLVVPLVLTVFLPTVFLLAARFAPTENGEFERLLSMLPYTVGSDDLGRTLANLLLNYVLPMFFLIIPIMAASVTAASSFVGEKEKRTLETLLYSPLSLKQIFQAKVLASFVLSMFVSLISFLVMLTVLEAECCLFIGGGLLLPGVSWLLVMLLLAPAVSLIAVMLIVRVSARAQSMEDAQQSAVFLLLPVIIMVAGQFSGILLISAWLLLGIGLGCALLAVLMFRKAMGNFRYELLL